MLLFGWTRRNRCSIDLMRQPRLQNCWRSSVQANHSREHSSLPHVVLDSSGKQGRTCCQGWGDYYSLGRVQLAGPVAARTELRCSSTASPVLSGCLNGLLRAVAALKSSACVALGRSRNGANVVNTPVGSGLRRGALRPQAADIELSIIAFQSEGEMGMVDAQVGRGAARSKPRGGDSYYNEVSQLSQAGIRAAAVEKPVQRGAEPARRGAAERRHRRHSALGGRSAPYVQHGAGVGLRRNLVRRAVVAHKRVNGANVVEAVHQRALRVARSGRASRRKLNQIGIRPKSRLIISRQPLISRPVQNGLVADRIMAALLAGLAAAPLECRTRLDTSRRRRSRRPDRSAACCAQNCRPQAAEDRTKRAPHTPQQVR